MKPNCYQLIRICFLGSLIVLLIASCQKLDEDGGYFDKKAGIYKYVFPNAEKGVRASEIDIKSPQVGVEQQIHGIISRIEPDLKSVWIHIASRQVYMILAESLAKGNRDDKNKQLKITLKYVSPRTVGVRKINFRKQWTGYVKKVLENQLLKQPILADIQYEDRSKRFTGIIYRLVKTKNGDRIRNINRWMIHQGLSYYFIDRGRASRHEEFTESQNRARKRKAGIWRYN